MNYVDPTGLDMVDVQFFFGGQLACTRIRSVEGPVVITNCTLVPFCNLVREKPDIDSKEALTREKPLWLLRSENFNTKASNTIRKTVDNMTDECKNKLNQVIAGGATPSATTSHLSTAAWFLNGNDSSLSGRRVSEFIPDALGGANNIST